MIVPLFLQECISKLNVLYFIYMMEILGLTICVDILRRIFKKVHIKFVVHLLSANKAHNADKYKIIYLLYGESRNPIILVNYMSVRSAYLQYDRPPKVVENYLGDVEYLSTIHHELSVLIADTDRFKFEIYIKQQDKIITIREVIQYGCVVRISSWDLIKKKELSYNVHCFTMFNGRPPISYVKIYSNIE